MAILEKRRAVNKLPRFERYRDTRAGDRSAALRGETPITSAVRQLAGTSGYGPMNKAQGFGPMGGNQSLLGPTAGGAMTGAGGAGGAKIDKFGNVAGQPKTAVTSALKSSTSAKPVAAKQTAGKLTSTGSGAAKTAGTTSKTPGLTTKTGATTGKTLTSTGTGTAAKTTGTTAGTKTTGGSKLGSTLTSGLAGAALGAGTKFVVDKLTGGTKTTGGTGTKVTGGTGTQVTGGTGTKTTGTTGTAGTGAVTSRVVTPSVKGTGTTVNVGSTGPKTPTGTGPKTPTSTGPKTPAGPKTPTGGATRGVAGGAGAAAGAAGTDATDETDTTVAGVAYDDEGNLMPGYELDENGNPVWVGFGEDTTTGGEGTDTTGGGTSETLDDGTVVNYDANGDIVSYTDTDGLTYDADGNEIGGNDTDTTGDSTTDGLFSDDEGNLYDADGNLVQYADGSSPEDDGATDVAYTDEDGNTYDAQGNLIAEADHSDYVYTDDYGNQYNWDGELISEGDHSDFTQTDADGNVYNWDGELISYADGTSPDDYTDDDSGDDGSGEEEPPEERKGGLIHMADGGEPISEKQNDDGTIVQMFDDGSSITYDQDGEVIDVSEPKNFDEGGGAYSDTTEEVQPWQNVDYNYGEDDSPVLSGDNSLYSQSGPYNPTYRTASTSSNSGGLSQFSGGNRVYYDDGSSVETFDDGSTIIYDSDGNVYNTSNAYDTTYDDEGNAIVTDGYGNIVSVYDPQGNVIPLGGGRVTGPTQVTGAGGSGGVDIDKAPTIQERIAQNKQNKQTEGAISDLLSGLNTYGGAGIAGAVLGSLLGNTDLFGGGGGGSGGGIDMSKVGVINPRTTDFGIGPARFVGYDEYGTPEQMPELYGTELYQNLNAPGFNEVNPGDYARYDEAEFGPEEEYTSEDIVDEEGQGMAEGGMPQGGLGQAMPQTYYTFGKAVDPLQNLRNPTPFQPQQQTPPQAAQNAQQTPPQQALPQTGMAPNQPSIPQGTPPAGVGMKSGGLPAWSQVPITNGRLNFRQGAAVHGAGDGQSDDIPAMLADGEYVIDAETVAQIGNGSTKAGAQALDKFRENIRAHKRSAPLNKIPPKTKALTSYLKGAR